ncbi:helix-turn-helix domain-containing protein [Streptomyces decoyicus]|uniref:helix-turn-helix domain-containing protein n=1 Tax=Streptomyces decoyicus TaxID=249567 RepID=UPI0033B33F3A
MCTAQDGACVSPWLGVPGGDPRVAQPEGTPVRPWAIAEDQVKVAASAGHVEVAFSRSKWPLAPVIAGAGAVTGGAGCGVPVIHFGRSVRPPCPSALPVDSPERRRTRAVEEDGLRPQNRAPAAGACAGRPVRRARTLQRAHLAWETGLHLDTVRRWRGRFAQAGLPGFKDRRRCGRPASFTPLQATEVKALTCQLPAETGVPISRWSRPELAREAITRQIVTAVSPSSVRRWLTEDALKPWQLRSARPAHHRSPGRVLRHAGSVINPRRTSGADH